MRSPDTRFIGVRWTAASGPDWTELERFPVRWPLRDRQVRRGRQLPRHPRHPGEENDTIPTPENRPKRPARLRPPLWIPLPGIFKCWLPKKGFEDARGTLFLRLLAWPARRPAYLRLRTFRDCLRATRADVFVAILATLNDLGHTAEWMVLNSVRGFRVPQVRKRVSVIGYLDPRCRKNTSVFGTDGKLLYKSPAGRRDRESLATPEGPPV